MNPFDVNTIGFPHSVFRFTGRDNEEILNLVDVNHHIGYYVVVSQEDPEHPQWAVLTVDDAIPDEFVASLNTLTIHLCKGGDSHVIQFFTGDTDEEVSVACEDRIVVKGKDAIELNGFWVNEKLYYFVYWESRILILFHRLMQSLTLTAKEKCLQVQSISLPLVIW